MDTDREIKTTRTWGLTILAAVLVPSIGFMVWVGGIDNRVSNNTEDIRDVKAEIHALNQDIRAILVGIEQVKARLGIVESE